MNRSIFLCSLMAIMFLYIPTVSAESQEKCFINEGLKQKTIVRISLSRDSATGTLTMADNDDDTQSSALHPFTADAKRVGSLIQLYVMFNSLPYPIPIVWTLAKKDHKEILLVPIYGKNYETKKYETSPMELRLTPCRNSLPA